MRVPMLVLVPVPVVDVEAGLTGGERWAEDASGAQETGWTLSAESCSGGLDESTYLSGTYLVSSFASRSPPSSSASRRTGSPFMHQRSRLVVVPEARNLE